MNSKPLSMEEIQTFLDQMGKSFKPIIMDLSKTGAVLEFETNQYHLRPGGTVSGPTMMALADAAMYVAILGNIEQGIMAATTNLNINFYRRPKPGRLRAEARLLKIGGRLAVGDVLLFNNDEEESVAHVSLTYSIPPQPSEN